MLVGDGIRIRVAALETRELIPYLDEEVVDRTGRRLPGKDRIASGRSGLAGGGNGENENRQKGRKQGGQPTHEHSETKVSQFRTRNPMKYDDGLLGY